MADYTHAIAVGDSATILYSKDTGLSRTWYHLQSPCDKRHSFNGVSYHDANHAAIISDRGLIFTTSDAGATWKQVATGMTNQTLRGIIRPYSGGLIVVGDSGIILRSINSGGTWTKIPSHTTRNIYAISVSDRGIGYFVGDHGLIGRTTDNGATWPDVTDTISNLGANLEGINFRAVAVDDNLADTAYAVGDSGGIAHAHSGMWSAIDPESIYGPSSFGTPEHDQQVTRVRHSNFAVVSFRATIGGDEFTLSGPGDFTIKEFQPAGELLTYQPFSVIGSADGGTDDAIARFTCAFTWKYFPKEVVLLGQIGEGISGENDFNTEISSEIVQPEVPCGFQNFLFASIDTFGKGFATAVNGIFLKTSDHGLTWTQAYPAFTQNSNYTSTDICTIDSNNAFAVGWGGNMYRTSNGGKDWDSSLIDPARERLHSIAHPAEQTFVVCGDYGTILYSTDNAHSWNVVSSTTTAYLESIAFSTPQIGVAVGTSGTIIRTTDQGRSWKETNNILTGTTTSFRQVIAFTGGLYYATTDSSGLFRSTDNGLNWNPVFHAPETIGIGFYDQKIGVIARSAWSSLTVPDTMRFAFTRDGFATAPIEFDIPMINNNRVAIHFLDSNTFLCFGSYSFVVKVDMAQGTASVSYGSATRTAAPLQIFPNPSKTHRMSIEYDVKVAGTTTIELWDAHGVRVQTLYSAEEEVGRHSRALAIDPALHGANFVKVLTEETVTSTSANSYTVPIIVE